MAFYKGKFLGWPGYWRTTFGYRKETCGPAGCMIDLAILLFFILIGRMVISNVIELGKPKIFKFWHIHCAVKPDKNKHRERQSCQKTEFDKISL